MRKTELLGLQGHALYPERVLSLWPLNGNIQTFRQLCRAAGMVDMRVRQPDGLQRHAEAGTLPKMLWQHDQTQPVGAWSEVVEDDTGLRCAGSLILDVAKAQEAYALLKAGAIDGLSMLPIDGEVIRTRRKLRDDGAVFASVTLDEAGQLLGEVQLATPGILDRKEDMDLIEELQDEIKRTIEQAKKRATDDQIKESVRVMLRRSIQRELEKKPVLEVHITRLAG